MNPDMNSNFSFNSPSIARPALVFAKSRISKRRGINRPNLKPDSQSGPGVNPFLLGSEYSSVLASPRPREDSPVIGESGLRSKESVDNLAEGVLDELRSLKIGINDAASSMNANSCLDSKGGNDSSRILGGGSSILEEDLRKLNIQVSENGPSEKNDNVDESVRKDSKPGAGIGSGLPDELQKKLNINVYSAEKTADLSSSVERSTAIFPDQLKNLNVEGSSSTATAANRDDPNIQTQENASFLIFGGRGNSSDCIGVTESLLSNAIQKKLNIGSESAESYQLNKDGFSFTSKQTDMGASFVEFKTPSSKLNPVSSFNQKELTAKREKIDSARLKKRGKSRQQPTHVQPQTAQDFVSTLSASHELDASLSYSPMDVSPYPKTLEENRSSRETSVTSSESFSIDRKFSSNDSEQLVSNNEVDQVLVAAAQRMEINSDDETQEVRNDSAQVFERVVGHEGPSEGYTSTTETESFKSATDEIDLIRDDAVSSADKTANSCSSSLERKDSGGTTQYFSCSHSEETAGSNFTFSAFSAAQGKYSAPKRSNKKKPSINAGYSPYNVEIPHPSSSILQFTSSATSSLLSPQLERDKRSTSQYKDVKDSKINVAKDGKLKSTSPTSTTMAAQEACEKWRLRGNQAYTSGDMSKAEDCYTQGIKCIPRTAMSRSCLRALMLCYSNRAATRISLGRMRDALEDCLMATEIDPNFFKVLLRAANCYLALGESEEALHFYRKCLHSRADSEVCVDRKIAVEASEGIQKAQKVSQCMNDSAELLLARTSKDAENSLEIISEALIISAYSEKLVEMKVEALFLLQRYQEVIQLCEQTLDLAEKNSISAGVEVDIQSENWDASEFSKRFHFRFWRCSLSFKSYFHLGKLEEGLASLEKQAEQLLAANRYGYYILESSIPLVKTVREVINLKNSGNEAFQAGKHAEAVDLYTAALSCNVESRPFAAICFCNRAAAYKALGQITDAIADCSLAIALDGNYWKAISRRATLYEMIRDYGQAAMNLERLVSVLTNHVEKASQGGGYDRSQRCASELRQARIRLSDIEEEAKKDIPLDMYLIMGVESSASASEIKKAYRKAALRHHPDKALQYLGKGDGGDEKVWKEIAEGVYKDADRLFKMIGEAYAVLSDTTKRSRYDAEEELRKKRGGGCKDEESYGFERNGSGRHQWREVWNSSQARGGGGGGGGYSDSNRWARYT